VGFGGESCKAEESPWSDLRSSSSATCKPVWTGETEGDGLAEIRESLLAALT